MAGRRRAGYRRAAQGHSVPTGGGQQRTVSTERAIQVGNKEHDVQFRGEAVHEIANYDALDAWVYGIVTQRPWAAARRRYRTKLALRAQLL